MTQEQKRIAIADAVGKDADYFNDLNAMHEAEKTLSVNQLWVYDKELSKLCGVSAGIGLGKHGEWTWHCTATQRAEAFGKTLNLW